jgi:small subunit ribosomal protein S1
MTEENTQDPLPTPETSGEPVPQALAPDSADAGVPSASQPGAAEAPAPDATASEPQPVTEPEESFADALSAFERAHTHRTESGAKPGAKQLEGTVVSITPEQVYLDVGYKIEGVLPRTAFPDNAEAVKRGDTVPVSITGRNEEGYYQLSRFRVAQPRDWSALEAAFAQKLAVAGTVTAAVKGGLSVDVGVRAFMPLSRSGARDAAEVEALIGQQITCRITKLDVADENVVVDRRVVLEEQARTEMQARRAALEEGVTVTGTVRSLMPYGAFVDIGGGEFRGIEGLLHVSDMAHTRVAKPEDVVSVGQQVQVRILKIDPASGKISLGLKQLQPEPWQAVPERYQQGQRISGAVTRVTDFGAFVEIEPGVEGMIHISEMSWAKKVRHPSDLLKPGDRVDAVILSIKPPTQSEAGRIALGLKQTLADPWLDAQRKFPIGSQVQGPVTKIMNFGAFVEVAEGVEGLVHISEIVAERRLNHPSDVLRAGQVVKAMVLGIDPDKRQMKLSIKQALPTSLDEYIAEQKAGDQVSGRVVEISGDTAVIELGEGIRATCRIPAITSSTKSSPAVNAPSAKADLSSLTSMLQARWKGAEPSESAQAEPLAEGQVRSFKIGKLNADKKQIEVELA